MRILLLILAVGVAWLILKRLAASKRTSTPKIGESTQMVRCEQCGVHLAMSDAIKHQQHYFCSPEHKKQYLS